MAARGLLKVLKPIIGWHGTPHNFDRFEISPRTIGTGEGNQMRGPGAYITDTRKVGEYYREALAGPRQKGRVIIDGVYDHSDLSPQDRDAADELYSRLWPHFDQLEEDAGPGSPLLEAQRTGLMNALKNHDEAQFGTLDDNEIRYIKEALRVLDEGRAVALKPRQPGHLLETAIHADPETDMIYWDKPAREQPAILEKMGIRADDIPELPKNPDLYRSVGNDGQELWERAVQKAADDDWPAGVEPPLGLYGKRLRDASLLAAENLKAKGIVGVKYLDGNSRADGDGTHNYAIWDDRVLEILKRYGLPLTSAGLATLAAALNDQQETA